MSRGLFLFCLIIGLFFLPLLPYNRSFLTICAYLRCHGAFGHGLLLHFTHSNPWPEFVAAARGGGWRGGWRGWWGGRMATRGGVHGERVGMGTWEAAGCREIWCRASVVIACFSFLFFSFFFFWTFSLRCQAAAVGLRVRVFWFRLLWFVNLCLLLL